MNIVEAIWCNDGNYSAGRSAAVDHIVIHYTGTSASARNNCRYFRNNGNAGASAHYFIDKDGSQYQSVSENDTAWHSGSWPMNCRSIGIEVVSAGEDFTEAQINSLADIVADIRSRYNIADVIRHYDVTGKLCPAPYVDWSKWNWLKGRIMGGPVTAPPSGGNISGKTLEEVARDVIAGNWGNGADRVSRLSSAGYDAAAVQDMVNSILGGGSSSSPSSSGDDIDSLARRVLNGEFGNGEQRRAALGSKYDAVQDRVNQILWGDTSYSSAPSSSSSIDDLAQRVLNGEFGNGAERKAALGSNYDAVQARVNEILSGGTVSSSQSNIDALAQRVINGEFGNGEQRRAALGNLYNAVQDRVNELLG